MAGRKILMVEGTDDEHVLSSICCKRGIIDLCEVKSYGGYEGVRDGISTRLSFIDEGDIVGIIIDADSILPSRWQSISDRLTTIGYPSVPKTPDPQGTILQSSDDPFLPRLGVWLMPNNHDRGAIEDFLLALMPCHDNLYEHATTIVDSLPKQRFADKDKLKANIHTWLAWQKNPGRPYGTSITAGFLDPHSPLANTLVCWLKRLFQLA